MKKKLGIIGGMGPLATADLFRMIIENTKSDTDAGHIRIFVDNNPQIPDRTASILGNGISPVPEIVHSGNLLEKIGADILLLPCNTSHYYFEEIQRQLHSELINMVQETVNDISKKGIKKVGLLATVGTIKGQVFDHYFQEFGIVSTPLNNLQQRVVMDFIYSGVKAGNASYDCKLFMETVNALLDEGAETLILGCTEIPVGKKMYNLSFPSIDAMEVLAKTAIQRAGYELTRGGNV